MCRTLISSDSEVGSDVDSLAYAAATPGLQASVSPIYDRNSSLNNVKNSDAVRRPKHRPLLLLPSKIALDAVFVLRKLTLSLSDGVQQRHTMNCVYRNDVNYWKWNTLLCMSKWPI